MLPDKYLIMNNKCNECGAAINGRADRKFCSDGCRNSYNYRLNSDSTNYVRNINNVLRKNRRILQEFCPGEKISVKKDQLLFKGFNFNYFTNNYITKTGKTYHFCYEYGYLPLENDFYMIVLRQEYVH